MFNEIIQLHPPAAKLILERSPFYFYEYWLNEFNRVDFYTIAEFKNTSISKGPPFQSFYEVGNAYKNKQQVCLKITQILRYREVLEEATPYLVIPHQKLENFIEKLANMFGIKVLYVEPIKLNFSYKTFYDRVVAKSANHNNRKVNYSAFTKLGFTKYSLQNRDFLPSLIQK